MESWRKGELERWVRQRAGRGWPISWCVGVCVCEGLEGPQSWWGENRIVLRAWHGAFDCATSERTVQGLDGTPAGFESQLDSATEEQHAGPCPFPGDVKDQGGLCVRVCVCGGGGNLGRGGEEMSLSLKQCKGERGQWGHRTGEFLKGLELKEMEGSHSPCQCPGRLHLSDRSAWTGPQGQGGSPGQSVLTFIWGLGGSEGQLSVEGVSQVRALWRGYSQAGGLCNC